MMTIDKKLIPTLRFPQFSGEWEVKRLGDIASKIGSGKTPSGGVKVYTTTGIPFIRSQNVVDDKLVLDGVCISEKIHFSMKSSVVYPNDILLNITGASIGRSCVVSHDVNEANVNQHVCIIRLKENHPIYIQLLLSSSIGQKLIYQTQTGSGREGLNFQSISNFKLTIPTLPEQEKIASFLSSIDRKVELLKAKKEQLEQYKKGMMQQLFAQTIRFKDQNGNQFPEWQEKRLGEVYDSYSGLKSKTKDDFGTGSKYITYRQVFNNSIIDLNDCERVFIGKKETNQNLVSEGDVFFTVSSETYHEVGMSSTLLTSINEAVYLNSFCFGVTPLSSDLTIAGFMRFYFRNQLFRKKVLVLSQGSTRYNISKVEFMKIKINLPSLPEQQKIADFLSAIDRKIEGVGQQMAQTELFKKAMLQQLFV